MATDEARYRVAERRLWEHEGVTPTERWLDLERTGVRVRVQEVGDGPPALFVHGASNSGSSWASLAARLPGHRCLLLDRPGCGLSDRLHATFDDVPAFGRHAESMIVDVLDALELERADLVATSLGGYHALRTAGARPERIGRVVELGWTVGAPVDEVPLLMRLTAVRSVGRLMTRVPINRRAARSMLVQIGLRDALATGRVAPVMVDWWMAQINHTDTMRNEIEAGPPILHLTRGFNDAILLTDELLARIDVPVLFLWGADDLFGGESIARAFTARIPTSELEMVGGGHAVWMDDPDGIARATDAFLTRQS